MTATDRTVNTSWLRVEMRMSNRLITARNTIPPRKTQYQGTVTTDPVASFRVTLWMSADMKQANPAGTAPRG